MIGIDSLESRLRESFEFRKEPDTDGGNVREMKTSYRAARESTTHQPQGTVAASLALTRNRNTIDREEQASCRSGLARG